MRPRKAKLTTTLSGVIVAALVLGACGSGGDTGSGELSGQTLEVAGVWSGEEQAAFEEVLALFEERTGATVTYSSAGDELPIVLQTRVDGSTPPNVAVLPQPGLIAQFARSGDLQPLPEDTRQLVSENYTDVWRELGTLDGREYAVFFKAANKSTFWYNDTLFQEVGVEPPGSIEELRTVAQTLADSGVAPLSVGAADGWVLTDWFENIYLQTAGPELYGQLARHEIPWTHPSVQRSLEIMDQLLTDEFLAGGLRSAMQTEFPASVGNVFGPDPQAATVYEGDFVAGVITSSTSAVLGEDARFFPFPPADGREPGVVVGGDAAVAFTDDEATAELMRFLASPEAAQVWADRGGFLSPNRNVPADAYPDEVSQAIAQHLLDAGENVRFDLSDSTPTSFGATRGAGMWQDLQDFVAGSGDVAQTMARLQANALNAFSQ